MANMKQILYFTRKQADIYFPEDDVRCQLCPLLQTYSRNQCMLTGELIADTRGIGWRCPLEDVDGEANNASISITETE